MTPLRFSTPAPPCLYSTAAADILLDKRLLAPRSTVPHTHTHTVSTLRGQDGVLWLFFLRRLGKRGKRRGGSGGTKRNRRMSDVSVVVLKQIIREC